MGVRGQRHAPTVLPLGKRPGTYFIGAEWVPVSVWMGVQNIAPPGFDPRIVHPVASRYTNWAILVRRIILNSILNK